MLRQEPRWNPRTIWPAALGLGLGLELLGLLFVRRFEGQLVSAPWLFGLALFALTLAYLYLAGQALDALFHVRVVPGMSLALLGAMLGWAALGAAILFVAFLAVMGVAGVLLTPCRLIYFASRRLLTASPLPSP